MAVVILAGDARIRSARGLNPRADEPRVRVIIRRSLEIAVTGKVSLGRCTPASDPFALLHRLFGGHE